LNTRAFIFAIPNAKIAAQPTRQAGRRSQHQVPHRTLFSLRIVPASRLNRLSTALAQIPLGDEPALSVRLDEQHPTRSRAGEVVGQTMKAVVVIGRDEDLCCQLVMDRLRERGTSVIYLPEDRLFPSLRFTWKLDEETSRGRLAFEERAADFSAIGAVLARAYGIPVSAEEYSHKNGQYLSAEWNGLLQGWLANVSGRVVNRLRPELWYKASLSGAALVALMPDFPLPLPRSLTTTRMDEVRAFYDVCAANGGIRLSPLTQPGSYVVDDAATLDKVAKLSGLIPFHLTEIVRGETVDAFIIGEEVILAAVDGVGMEGAQNTLRGPCVAIGTAFSLAFFQLKLVHTAGGEWYCRQLETMPDLAWQGAQVQQAVAGKLAAFLAGDEEIHL
jgi:hypothetical protein